MKPRYNPEITLGHIAVVISFLISVGLMQFPKHSDVTTLLKDVARHEQLLEKLADNSVTTSANMSLLTRLLNDHLDWEKSLITPHLQALPQPPP